MGVEEADMMGVEVAVMMGVEAVAMMGVEEVEVMMVVEEAEGIVEVAVEAVINESRRPSLHVILSWLSEILEICCLFFCVSNINYDINLIYK